VKVKRDTHVSDVEGRASSATGSTPRRVGGGSPRARSSTALSAVPGLRVAPRAGDLAFAGQSARTAGREQFMTATAPRAARSVSRRANTADGVYLRSRRARAGWQVRRLPGSTSASRSRRRGSRRVAHRRSRRHGLLNPAMIGIHRGPRSFGGERVVLPASASHGVRLASDRLFVPRTSRSYGGVGHAMHKGASEQGSSSPNVYWGWTTTTSVVDSRRAPADISLSNCFAQFLSRVPRRTSFHDARSPVPRRSGSRKSVAGMGCSKTNKIRSR